jgi:hypothetical protein
VASDGGWDDTAHTYLEPPDQDSVPDAVFDVDRRSNDDEKHEGRRRRQLHGDTF